jgi:GTP-binding protein
VLILANKMDKLAGGARRAAKDRIARDAADVVPGGAAMIRVVAFSALRGIGVDEAIAALAEWLHEDPTSSPATANMHPEPGPQNKRPRRQGE